MDAPFLFLRPPIGSPSRPRPLAERRAALFFKGADIGRCAAIAAAWALGGCNAVLGNEDHPLVTDDGAAAVVPRVDAGDDGNLGSGTLDSGAGGVDGGTGAQDGQPPPPDTNPPGEPEAGAGDTGVGPPAPIAFVQVASQDNAPKDGTTSARVAYVNPQQAGDLNVVVVGWGNSSHAVTDVSDSAGNLYMAAAAPASNSGAAVAVYYAAVTSSSGSNTVTVTLDHADALCVAILEYSGVTELDQTGLGAGSGDSASTNTVSTTVARELVIGVGEPDQTGNSNFANAGPGFTQRIITTLSGMLAEDKIVSQAGTYSATGSLDSSSAWAMQIVTFK